MSTGTQVRPRLNASIQAADVLVVGAGLFGITIAERVASQCAARVLVIDRRNHIGGNAYSYFDNQTGVEVHQYGSHLFHTSNQQVWDYANQFTAFNSYQHRVVTSHNGQYFSMPINLATISQFFGRALTPSQARILIAEQSQRERREKPRNLEDKAVSSVGRPLYEALIRGYTLKQWQTDPRKLPASTIARLPVRFNFDDRYFSDTWEGLPLKGYGNWFMKMIDLPGIEVRTEVDFFDIRGLIPKTKPIVYTGPIDRFFGYKAGRLNWRTLDFEFETHSESDVQGTAVINYADESVPYTRIHEFKHLHPERWSETRGSVTAKEFSRYAQTSDEPYYPVNSSEDRNILEDYRELVAKENGVIFGGRLGTYQYLDMHMAIASALKTFENEVLPRLSKKKLSS